MSITCTTCNQALSKRGFKEHTRRFHPTGEEEQIICVVCDKLFSTKRALKIHTRKFHKNEEANDMSTDIFHPKIPELIIESTENISEPLETDSPMLNPTEYSLADFLSGTSEIDRINEKIRKETLELKCDVCNKTYKKKGCLITHKRKIHNMGTKTLREEIAKLYLELKESEKQLSRINFELHMHQNIHFDIIKVLGNIITNV